MGTGGIVAGAIPPYGGYEVPVRPEVLSHEDSTVLRQRARGRTVGQTLRGRQRLAIWKWTSLWHVG